MERLTGRDNGNPYQISCFEGDGCLDMETKKCHTCPHQIAVYEKLAAYEDAEEQGCNGCKHKGLYEKQAAYGFDCPCYYCKRRKRETDNYESKLTI